jgi:hypothetical protein
MKRTLTFIIALIALVSVQAQQLCTVVDSITGEPLIGAAIYIKEGHGAFSNNDGQFVINPEIGDSVRISYVGYRKFVTDAASLPKVIKMHPLTRSLKELTVTGVDALLMKVAQRLKTEYSKNHSKVTPFLTRMMFRFGRQTEMVEAFIEAAPSVNLRNLTVTSGQYWRVAPSGERIEPNLKNTNMHLLFSTGATIRDMDFWNYLTTPLPYNVSTKYLHNEYDIRVEDIAEEGRTTLYCITLTPKGEKRNKMSGTLFVRPGDAQLERFEGTIHDINMYVSYPGSVIKTVSDEDVRVVINYAQRDGFTQVNTLTFNISNKNGGCYGTMTNISDYNPEGMTSGKRVAKNLVQTIESVGHNPELDKYVALMNRTIEEDAIINASSHEMAASPEVTPTQRLLVSKAVAWNKLMPQEKVYIHLDNTGYFKGETIWMKAYMTRSDTGLRGNISSVLYVDLISPDGNVVARRKLFATHGIAAGSIDLDADVLPSGYYEIRAYTRYMMNWGENNVFSRVIPIFDKPVTEGDYSNPKMTGDSRLLERKEEVEKQIRFFPEGGYLVKGLPGRVAWEYRGKRGVMDVPPIGDKRSVDVDIDGKTHTTLLPEPQEEGCVLRVDATRADSVVTDVYATESFQDKELLWMLMHEGQVVKSNSFKASSHWRYSEERSTLPEGVSQVTLLSDNGAILAERFIFIAPKTETTAAVKNLSGNLTPCGRVSLDIEAEPHTSLSFSAIDAQSATNGRSGNIRTWMLLGSDLKGYIANPDYYFEADDEEHRKAADLLMLVQGWRRYDWDFVTGRRWFEHPQIIEENLNLFGTVKAKKDKKKTPVENVSVTATFSGDGQKFFLTAKTDSTGRYAMVLPDIQDDWSMNMMTSYDGKKADYTVTIDRNFAPKPRIIGEDEKTLLPVDTAQIQHWDIPVEEEDVWKPFITDKSITTIREVKVNGKKRDNHYDYSARGDETDAIRKAVLYYNCEIEAEEIADRGDQLPTLGEWLHEKNPLFEGGQPTSRLAWDLNDYANTNTGTADPTWDELLSELVIDVNTMNLPDNEFKGTVAHIVRSKRGDEITTYKENPSILELYAQLATGTRHNWAILWGDGTSILNKPVVWIVNNQFCSITNFKGDYLDTNRAYAGAVDNNSFTTEIPVFLDEVRSIYATDDLSSLRQHIRCNTIEEKSPYIIYCYTYLDRPKERMKGVRYAHYHGYDPVEVFETEDYSDIAPVSDYRRTLFWEPNLWTDENGKAHVEFWNNSSCTNMLFSVEGITGDGKLVTEQHK